jgi:hypothetical protein
VRGTSKEARKQMPSSHVGVVALCDLFSFSITCSQRVGEIWCLKEIKQLEGKLGGGVITMVLCVAEI